jgi:SAM-dependent methyltransferase
MSSSAEGQADAGSGPAVGSGAPDAESKPPDGDTGPPGAASGTPAAETEPPAAGSRPADAGSGLAGTETGTPDEGNGAPGGEIGPPGAESGPRTEGDATAAPGTGAADGEARRAVVRARHAASKAREAADDEARRARMVRELFARPVHDYLSQVLGRPVAVLRAGCQTPVEELGLENLRESGFEISVTTVDQDDPVIRAADPSGQMLLGDLRTVPLPPRSFDIVYCGFLLERISHAPLVLDRFVGALRPGGLLLLRIRDRDSAAAALDRIMPEAIRKALWSRLRAGQPGPFPAIYDSLASARGIQAYALAHGLVIARREVARTPPGPPGRLSSAVSAARMLIAWLSRGRLTDAHDELLYVIRKPEDRFARLV